MLDGDDTADFFRYLPVAGAAGAWGITVSGAGRFQAAAGEDYPPREHPSDHYFDWRAGRVLGALQVIMITRGKGEFETRLGGMVEIESGAVLLLLPGVWHRYRPVAGVGWTEKWVELSGSVVDGLLGTGTLARQGMVLKPTRPRECEWRLNEMHLLIQRERTAAAGRLASEALGLLAELVEDETPVEELRTVDVAVTTAQRWMEGENVARAMMPGPDMARALGVGYSYFRREFRRQTGVSPQQYQLLARLQRAQRLLGSTEHSIKQIADRLEFSSPYHFSAAFKSRFGVSPREWRQRRS